MQPSPKATYRLCANTNLVGIKINTCFALSVPKQFIQGATANNPENRVKWFCLRFKWNSHNSQQFTPPEPAASKLTIVHLPPAMGDSATCWKVWPWATLPLLFHPKSHLKDLTAWLLSPKCYHVTKPPNKAILEKGCGYIHRTGGSTGSGGDVWKAEICLDKSSEFHTLCRFLLWKLQYFPHSFCLVQMWSATITSGKEQIDNQWDKTTYLIGC